MKIGKATFDCTIGMPGFSNVKPGAVEIILEDGETVEEAWSELNRRALAWHKKEFPHIYQESYNTDIPPKANFYPTSNGADLTVYNLQDERDKSADVLLAIQLAPTLDELKHYKFIAGQPGNEELYKAYNSRVKELMK